MSDNTQMRGKDRLRAACEREDEMREKAEKLGVWYKKVKHAIAEAGNSREKAKEYLRIGSKDRE